MNLKRKYRELSNEEDMICAYLEEIKEKIDALNYRRKQYKKRLDEICQERMKLDDDNPNLVTRY